MLSLLTSTNESLQMLPAHHTGGTDRCRNKDPWHLLNVIWINLAVQEQEEYTENIWKTNQPIKDKGIIVVDKSSRNILFPFNAELFYKLFTKFNII